MKGEFRLLKKLLPLIAVVFLVAAGCQSGESQQVRSTDEEQTEKQEKEADAGAQVDENTSEEEGASEQGEYLYEVNQESFTIDPMTEKANSEVALLTFDDAPDGHAVQIAEILQEHDAPAIFFVNGMYLETDEGKEDLQTIHDMGFEIGNHTYTHPNLPDLSKEEQREEIVAVNDLVEEIIGERPRFFRAPFGLNTDYTEQVTKEERMELMNWTYGYDWEAEYQEPEALADIMVNTELLNDGANLLMHDREWTEGAVEDIVTGLRDKGYELVDPSLIYSPEEGGQEE